MVLCSLFRSCVRTLGLEEMLNGNIPYYKYVSLKGHRFETLQEVAAAHS
jgi:hypothetical protein